MGNYSTLWIAKDKEKYNEDTDEYLEVKYAIPLFWIALFTQDDIHKTHYENGDSYFFFETTIEKAKDNFQKRIHLWAKLYNNEKAEILANVFLSHLEQYPNHDIIFNVDDVLSMYLSFENGADKTEMIDMVQTIDQLNINPKSEIPFKHWLPNSFNFSSMKTRYFELDGMGEELLPCHEVDEWLNQNTQQSKTVKLPENTGKISSILDKKIEKKLPKNIIYLCIFIVIIFTLYKTYATR